MQTIQNNLPKPSAARSARALVGWLVLAFAAAALGGFFRPGEWFATLSKPSWNPPGWIFAPVWTALYTIMAVAAWLVWRRGGFAGQRGALSLFLVQLFFNALWSPLFFGLHEPALAFADIVLLWLALLGTVSSLFGKPVRLRGRCCCRISPGSRSPARSTSPSGNSIANHKKTFPTVHAQPAVADCRRTSPHHEHARG